MDPQAATAVHPGSDALRERHAQIVAALRQRTISLPSPGAVALELLRQLERRDSGFAELCRIARRDPVLVAKVIQLANSSLYAGLRPVASIEDAAMRIGAAALAQLALGLSLVHEAQPWNAAFDLRAYWRRALLRAGLMQALARGRRVIAQAEAFCLGLLCEIGELAMVAAFGPPSAPSAVADLREQRERWGFDQGQASAALLDAWGLPEHFWLALCGDEARGRALDLACLVDGASALLRGAAGDVPDALAAGAAELSKLLDELGAELEPLCAVFDISVDAQALGDELQRLRAALADGVQVDPRSDTALVVGFDGETRGTLAAIFRSAGIEVEVTPHLEEARAALARRDPLAIVLDAELPSGGALQWCGELRTIPGFRACLVVGGGECDARSASALLEAGADDCVERSAPSALLLARVRRGMRLARRAAALDGERRGALAQHHQLEQLNASLRVEAGQDPLTGAPNRRALERFLDSAWAHRVARSEPLSCVLFDLDRFKRINDNCGHDVGDRALRAVMLALQGQVRANEMVGRWGGEEMLLVCPQADGEMAQVVAERMRAAIEALQGDFPRLTISAGVAQAGGAADGPAALLRAADRALLLAKARGGNCSVLGAGESQAGTDARTRRADSR